MHVFQRTRQGHLFRVKVRARYRYRCVEEGGKGMRVREDGGDSERHFNV